MLMTLFSFMGVSSSSNVKNLSLRSKATRQDVHFQWDRRRRQYTIGVVEINSFLLGLKQSAKNRNAAI